MCLNIKNQELIANFLPCYTYHDRLLLCWREMLTTTEAERVFLQLLFDLLNSNLYYETITLIVPSEFSKFVPCLIT